MLCSEINRPRIIVFGLYKTGTTALFSNIRNCLSYTPRLLFESKGYKAIDGDLHSGVLAKVILGESDTDYESFSDFEKKILIIRDPRDWIVSTCLFNIQEIPEIYQDSKVLKEILALVSQKERDPLGYSFCDFLEVILNYTPLKDWDGFGTWVNNLHKGFIDFYQSEQVGLNLYYEDFVDRRIGELSQYLDIQISDDLTLDRAHAHVPRTKGYGNWKDWFIKEDVDRLRPIFHNYISCLGYDAEWHLNSKPEIRSEECSEYLDRITNLKLRNNFGNR